MHIKPKIEPMTDRDKIKEELLKFVDFCMDKFDKGRAEHGEDFNRIDYKKEKKQETADLLLYNIMESLFTNQPDDT